MFERFKKFLPSVQKQPAFAAAGVSEAAPLPPSKLDALANPAFETKPGLGARILKGLPGFVAQAGTVMGAKSLTTALLSSVSPVALAPVLGGAAAVGVGVGLNQSFKYARERIAQLEKEQGRDISLKTIFKEASLTGIKREATAYAKEVTSKAFWKKAASNGKWSIALGAALGIADHTEAGHEAIQLAKEKAAAAITRVTSINPFQRFSEMASGTAHANIAPAQTGVSSDTIVAANTAVPAEAPVATDQPYVPLTPMEKVHYIAQLKGSNIALDKMIARAEGGNMQAVKDLAVGLYNGKLGLPVDKETALQLFKVAADGGNTQAIRDLAFLTKGTVATATTSLTADAPKPQIFVPKGVGEDSRKAAMEQIRSIFGAAATTQPTVTIDTPAAASAATEAAAPPEAPRGKLAAFCDIISTAFNGAVSTHGTCTAHQAIINDGDYVGMKSDTGISKEYVYKGEPTQTRFFHRDTLLRFINNEVNPALR